MTRSNQTSHAELYAEWHGGYMHINDQRLSPGRRLYVSSVTGGTAGGDGDSPENPISTVAGAIALATTGDYDQIILMPGHVETLAAAGAIDTTGVDVLRIIGVGLGADRPTFTYTNVNATTLIASASVTIENCIFVTGLDNIVTMVSVQGTDFHLKDCEFREGAALETLTYVTIGGGGANTADRCHVEGCRMFSPVAGSTQAISISEVQDSVIIEDNFMCHDGTAAVLWSDQINTNILVKNNTIHSLAAGVHAIEFTVATTGMIEGNHLYGDTLGTVLDPGSCWCMDNLEVDAIDQAAIPTPATTSGPFLTNAFDADAIAADTLTNAHIANDAITATEIANAAIDGPTFANDVGAWRVAISNYNFGDDGGAAPLTLTIFTVTDDVEVRVVAVCDDDLAAAAAPTIEVGVAGNTAVILAQVADGRTFDVDEIWTDAGISATACQLAATWPAAHNNVLSNGQDINFLAQANNLTAGDIDFYCLWRPLSATGNVVAA